MKFLTEKELLSFIKKYFDFNEYDGSYRNDFYTTYCYILYDNLDLHVSISSRKDENGNTFYYINKFYITTWDNGFSHKQRWIEFDFMHSKEGIYNIFFRISSSLCDKLWVKQLNTKLPIEGQCYFVDTTNTDIYAIIIDYFNELFPVYIGGKIREEQIKSVLSE